MREFSLLVFDEVISGISSLWYTSSDLCELLGNSDHLVLFGRTTYVSGTGAINCALEHSPDGRIWSSAFQGISNFAISEGAGVAGNYPSSCHFSLVRYRVSLTGTGPKCRLKLYVTGHSRFY